MEVDYPFPPKPRNNQPRKKERKSLPVELKAFGVGDTLNMKKPHACDSKSKKMLVLMAGSDVKVRCEGCGREMILPRVKLERSIKSVTRKEDTNV